MISTFDPAGPGLVVDAAIRSSVVLLAALGVTAMMRRTPAAARHLVWTLALGGALIIPLLGSVLPAWPVVTLPPVSTPVVSISAPGSVSLLASWEALAEPPAAPGVYEANAAIASPSAAGEPLDPRWLAAMLWGAGAGLLALRLLTGVVRVRWIARRATPVDDPAWLQLTHVLARRFGLARPVTLLRSEGGSVPMTWGTVYPVVLLPAEADRWSTERRTVVLAHELAHIRRWDAATQWLAHLALVLYWFNPLVWIAARRLRDERERACDDAVIAAGTRPTDYADHLLEIVRSLGVAEGPGVALAMARRSQFEGRLLAILDRAARRGGVSGRLLAGTAIVAAGVVLPLAAMRAAERDPQVLSSRAVENEAPTASPQSVTEVPAASAPTTPEEAPERPMPALSSAPAVPGSPHSVAAPSSAPEVVQTRAGKSVLVQLLQSVATRTSNGDKTAVLVQVAENHSLSDSSARKAFFEAARTISSSSDLQRVLSTVVARQGAHAQLEMEVLRSVMSISSSADRGAVLVQLIRSRSPLDDHARRLLLAAVDSMSSSSERERVLQEMLDRSSGAPDVLADVFRSAALISSSNSKANVLHRAATGYSLRAGPTRDAFFAALATISSDADYRRVASAVVGAPERSGSTPRKSGRSIWNTETTLKGSHHGAPAYTLTLRARDVVLNAERTDVAELPADGFLRIEHTRFPGSPDPDPLVPEGSRETLTRYLRVSRGNDGDLQRIYQVNGETRPWDAAAQTWLAGVLRRYRK